MALLSTATDMPQDQLYGNRHRSRLLTKASLTEIALDERSGNQI